MNILYLTNHLNIGGITSYVLSLSSGFKNRGHNVYIASSNGELLSKLKNEGINFIPIPIKTKKEISPKILLSTFKLLRFIKENNISIVHSNSRTTQVLGVLLNKFTHAQHISTCHGFFKKRFLRKTFPCWGKKVIAISEQVRQHLIDDFKLDKRNIVLIHNGVKIPNPQLSTPNSYGDRRQKTEDRRLKNKFGLKDGPVVGIVARLSDVKGHIYLIKAMPAILEKFPQAQLLIVGDGKLKDELVNLTSKLGIKKNVIYLPSVQDTQDVLQVMDIFVMPSLKEGLGLALMEAMASGLAVIGSDMGGIRSLIKNGLTGLLVEPANAEQLSTAISELLSNPEKREFLGRNAKKFIKENFSLEKMVLETERLYAECVS